MESRAGLTSVTINLQIVNVVFKSNHSVFIQSSVLTVTDLSVSGIRSIKLISTIFWAQWSDQWKFTVCLIYSSLQILLWTNNNIFALNFNKSDNLSC